MRHKKSNKFMKKFVNYMCKTWKNKLMVSILLAIGWITTQVAGECTFLIFVLMIFGPVFFINEDCFPSKN